jgi:NMD protein affecting ribosome stability and mRNA decay
MAFKISKNNYFEGILQLRNTNDEMHAFVQNQLDRAGQTIAQVKKHKDGYDLYISSQHFIQNLGKKLKINFGGKLEVSTRLHSQSRITSRLVYRITALYIAPNHRKGDVILAGKKIILITGIDKMIHGIDLLEGKKTTVDDKEIEILEKIKTTIGKIYPQVEIIDPDTYQCCSVRNKEIDRKYSIGEHVKVIYHEGYFLIP